MKIISSIKNNPLFAASFIMVFGMNLYNFGQFAFHFLVGRALGKALYGDLATLITILGFFAIVQNAVGLTIVKYITSVKEEKKNGFIKWVLWMSLLVGLFIGGVFIISSPMLSKFLNISDISSFLIFGPIVCIYILASTVRSVLQGLLLFFRYILSYLTESVVKIALVLILMLFGLKLLGAVMALLIGTLASLLIGYFYIKKYLKSKVEKPDNFAALLKYSAATLFQGLALTSMYSMDLVLVKHFFSPAEAGIYASVAILGRVVFFAVSPITHAAFPLIAKKHQDKEHYHHIFYTSLLLVSVSSLVLTLGYFFLPKLAINVLFGSGFLEGAGILWWYGLFMSFLAVAMFMTQFFLSIGKTKIISAFVGTAILQVILISLYHTSLVTVIQMSIICVALLDLVLFVYFLLREYKK